MCQKQTCPSNVRYIVHMQISICKIMRHYVSKHISFKCDQEHWYIHISHYWHIPLMSMLFKLLIYDALHCYHSLHIDPTSLHISAKNNKLQNEGLGMPYMPTTNTPSNAIYMLCEQIM